MLVIARGVLIGVTAASAIEGHPVRGLLGWLLGVVLAHGVVEWCAARSAQASVGNVVDSMRSQAMTALTGRDPRVVQEHASHWRHVLTRGMDDFRPYLTEFLPALIATVISTPVALAVVLYFDWVSAVFAVVTLPLIPIFMVLIGTLTRDRTEKRLATTAALGGQLADLLAGAPTLRALHAAARPAAQIRDGGSRHARATMGVLRLAFLSSFALEFLATLSIALVAVSIGLRLVSGDVSLVAGLTVLIIIPEVFNPVRRVGGSFHAAADGITAADEVLMLIDAPPELTGSYLRGVTDGAHAGVVVSGLSVHGRDGVRPSDLSFTARPGEITVLTGANGSGKSTTLLALVGALPDAAVRGVVDGVGVGVGSVYVPARPATVPGTAGSNVALFGAPPHAVPGACEAAELDLPLDHPVGVGGAGVSAGQLQRIGLARLFTSKARIVLADEPTAHLSPELVPRIVAQLRRLADEGRIVIVASHDHRVTAIADEVVEL
ncbi:ATP-binding cassette domain-containing protein [Corynebacterium aquatimens]|nr:ABC transporter transmembrane domain-containing protein [Corynebacterium aquatimens]